MYKTPEGSRKCLEREAGWVCVCGSQVLLFSLWPAFCTTDPDQFDETRRQCPPRFSLSNRSLYKKKAKFYDMETLSLREPLSPDIETLSLREILALAVPPISTRVFVALRK